MTDETKVIDFPGEEVTTDNSAPAEEAELNKVSFKVLRDTMRTTKEMVDFFRSTWESAKQEFGITDDQIAEVIRYNSATREPKREDQSDDDYDELNGLLGIPDEKLEEIFGKGSHLFGVERSQTLDRLRYAANLFHQLFNVTKEYRELESSFNEILEDNERASIDYLRELVNSEVDPEKKTKAKQVLDDYLGTKHLTFLTRMEDRDRGRLIATFLDQSRIKYVLEKGRRQLAQVKIPEMIILELSGFEDRYLPEKYHPLNNLVLLALLQLAAYGKPASNPVTKRQLSAMTIGLDRFIRKQLSPEDREAINANLIAFEESFFEEITSRQLVELKPADHDLT